MPRPRPKHLHRTKSRHGSIVWYVHVPGQKRIRIKGEYGSEAFMAAVDAALRGEVTKTTGSNSKHTLAWLIAEYKKSSAWAKFSPATQSQRDNIYKNTIKLSGNILFTEINRASIVKGREGRLATPNQANNFIKAMRSLFAWAVDAGIPGATNPTEGVKLLNVKTQGFHVWTDDEVERYEAHWPLGSRERLALDVLLYTGLRRGDATKLGPKHVKNGVFSIQTEKGGVWVTAPLLAPLVRSIETSPIGESTFIAGELRKPYSKAGFGNWFREACVAAGVPGAAHGLRKTGATRAAEAGCTERELMALYGWTDEAMPSLYTKKANRATMAAAGSSKLRK